jgi:hypothetical protein
MQQIDLFSRLQDGELDRAQTLELFANADRLALKPRCSNDKSHSVIRAAPHALAHTYIQPNAPVAFYRLVFDLDWHQPSHAFHSLPLRYLTLERKWTDELGVPEPSWIALSTEKNSAHVAYELATPVGRHENARHKPQRFLAAVEAGLSVQLGADSGFSGSLCKNPVNQLWAMYPGGPASGYELHDLAAYVDLTPTKLKKFNREPRGEVGRNVFIFDEVRFWAYDNIELHRSHGFEAWQNAVLDQAERLAAAGFSHLPISQAILPGSEIQSIARSVARWTWANYGKSSLTAAFSELQSWRGKRRAASTASIKRERTEDAIRNAQAQLLAEGSIPTLRAVAKRIGKSPSTLSEGYSHLFQQTAQ